MIKVTREGEYLFITVSTQYFGHMVQVHAPVSYQEGEELAHAITVELQEFLTERNQAGKLGSNNTCICISNLPVMAGCPVHDIGDDAGTVHSGR